jgi:peptidoglycan hydrolase CwlO-like protein
MKLRYKILGIAVAVVAAAGPLFVQADPLEDYAKTQQQLADQAAQVKTLSDEMRVLDQTIAAKSEYLKHVTAETEKVRGELAGVNKELGDMQRNKQNAQGKLNKLVRTDYLDGKTSAYFVLASADSLSTMTAASSYLGIFQEKTDGLVNKLDQLERRQEERQNEVTQRVQRLDQLESEAQKESNELAAVRSSKQQLLDSTQGQEDVYRQQYEAARAQLVKLGIFGSSGCSRVGAREWPETGGYFNQCDPRWSEAKLGFSDDSTIGDFGCGVTSLAIVYEQYGLDTDPLRMNESLKRTGGFVGDLMQWRNAAGPSGGALALANNPYGGVDWSAINGQLDAGNPVIVYVDRGTINHYVVLLRRSGTGYIMHDPIEGPNQRFSDHYSTSAVQQYITFRRN